MSSFHTCGKAWSAPGNFMLRTIWGCWWVLSQTQPWLGCAWTCPSENLPGWMGWRWCFLVLVLQGVICVVCVQCFLLWAIPRNRRWDFSDSQHWWYHTDLMWMCPQLQVWWGRVLEMEDWDINLRSSRVLRWVNHRLEWNTWASLPELKTQRRQQRRKTITSPEFPAPGHSCLPLQPRTLEYLNKNMQFCRI